MTTKIDLVVKYPNRVLFQECEPITSFDKKLVALANKMYFALRTSNGYGLAAPQIGISKRIFVWQDLKQEKYTEGYHTIVNPEIVNFSEETTFSLEGCLSIPEHWFELERHSEVTIRGFDLEGNEVEETASGLKARMFQHEMDHLDGKVLTYHLTNEQKASINATWNRKKKK